MSWLGSDNTKVRQIGLSYAAMFRRFSGTTMSWHPDGATMSQHLSAQAIKDDIVQDGSGL